MKKAPSLADYAKSHAPKAGGRKCWLCGIPERAEADESRRQGVLSAVIHRWLIEACGYPPEIATEGRMRSHFSSGRHHERVSA